jgi:hypothetical protein
VDVPSKPLEGSCELSSSRILLPHSTTNKLKTLYDCRADIRAILVTCSREIRYTLELHVRAYRWLGLCLSIRIPQFLLFRPAQSARLEYWAAVYLHAHGLSFETLVTLAGALKTVEY